ncbi:MAG TPA: hypothetical protein DDW31_06115 [candidate division Zixibacteria bacterium]|jgi:head-tail adaptor|nr:hypothetical protein [candidate division Zixibacteria bacterium]
MKQRDIGSKPAAWCALALAAALFLLGSVQLGAKVTSIAKITFYTGEVKTQPPKKDDWKKAIFQQPLANGEKIKTWDQSRAEIGFSDGSIIRIDGNSSLDIVDAKKDKAGQQVEAKVWSGKVWANVNKMSKKSKFELESPTAVAAIRGTVYRMAVSPDRTTRIAVYSGAVAVKPHPDFFMEQKGKAGGREGEIEGPSEIAGPTEVSLDQWIQIVKIHQEITINPDGTYGIVQFNPELDAQDDWVRWNQERDRAMGRTR